MVYVSFDTNIWIYSLDESWKLDNLLDYIEYWQETGVIEIVLPEIIIDEWERHEEREVLERKKTLNKLVVSLNQFVPKSYLIELNEEHTQTRLIDEQLERIHKVLSKSTKVSPSQKVKDKVIEDGINKVAPQHKKSSVADAIILHSFLDFISNKQNPANAFYFITENKADFSDSRSPNNIHPDLAESLKNLNVEFFKDLNGFTNKIKQANESTNPIIDEQRSLRIQNRLQRITYNPQYDDYVQSQESSVIANKETIDFILAKSKPTREQAIFILSLIDTNPIYEEYFYKKVDSEYWLSILHRKGVFHPRNSKKIVFKEGKITAKSYWYPISYIDKISSTALTPENTDLVLRILSDLSKVENDNYITWRHVIEATSKISNEKVPISLIQLSKNWIKSSKYFFTDTTFFIFQYLLPKFLNLNSTKEDIQKAEILLFNSIDIEINGGERINLDDSLWVVKTDVNNISYEYIDKELFKSIARHSSFAFVEHLGDIVRRLALDYPAGINLDFYQDIGGKEVRYFNFKIDFNTNTADDDLIIYELSEEYSTEYTSQYILEDYTSLSYHELKGKVASLLGIDLSVSQNSKHLDHLEWRLFYGKLKSYGSLVEFIDDQKNGVHPVNVFAIFYIKLLEERIKNNIGDSEEVLSYLFAPGPKKLAFNRKIGFYLLKFCWNNQKKTFWKEFSTNDLFSNSNEYSDVREVLESNQKYITKKESLLLKKAIDKGPPLEEIREGTDDKEYWQFRWLSALKNSNYFEEEYSKLNKQLELSEDHFSRNSRVRISSGYIPPISSEELKNLPIEEIVNYLIDFKSDGGFYSSNESGLAEVFRIAVKEDPNKFIEQIGSLKEIPEIYYKNFLYGLQEYWNNSLQRKKGVEKIVNEIDWQMVFNFCSIYLTNHFKNESPSRELIRATTSLVSSALHHNSELSNTALQAAKKLIHLLFHESSNAEDTTIHDDFDYPTYVINSVRGSILITTLEYSLHRVRVNDKLIEPARWEVEVKSIFEESVKQNPIDFYIVFGWHFWQLHYLDSRWTFEKAESLTGVSRTNLIAFMSGFVLSRVPNTKPLMSFFYPLYKKVILENLPIKYLQDSHVSNHIGTLYLWGFEELNNEDALISILLHTNNLEYLSKLVSFLNGQSEYVQKLTPSETEDVQVRILDLWTLIVDKLKFIEKEQAKEILKRSLRLIPYFSKLNNGLKEVIQTIVEEVELNISKDILIGDLKTLFVEESSIIHTQSHYQNLGELLLAIPFKNSYTRLYENNLLFLTELLYKNEYASLANNYCEKMSRDGFEFLNELYSKYNS